MIYRLERVERSFAALNFQTLSFGWGVRTVARPPGGHLHLGSRCAGGRYSRAILGLLPCAPAAVWHRAGAAPKHPQTHAVLSVLYNNHAHECWAELHLHSSSAWTVETLWVTPGKVKPWHFACTRWTAGVHIRAYISISMNVKMADLSCQRSEHWALQPHLFFDRALCVPFVRLKEKIMKKM